MATDLFERLMVFQHGSSELDDLAREVWTPTPWMVDVYTGRFDDDRTRDILRWCRDTFGQESSPIHERKGTWHRGGATINGWTWMGFATKEMLDQFMERWPTPEGVPALA